MKMIILATACALADLTSLARAREADDPPQPTKGVTTTDFSVDNQNRNEVVAFWHAVYQASEGYENRINWSGNYTGKNGGTSAAFVDDVERRLNYFRAMCGVHSHAIVNSGSEVVILPLDLFKPAVSTLKSSAAQDAALLLIRNYDSKTGTNPALTHNPPPGLTGWSMTSWNALSKGNFAFGRYGPGAITEYMVERLSNSTVTSSWNSLVGHRRWCLYPRATDFASGDQPGGPAFVPPTNSFYVIQHLTEIEISPQTGFVAYPAAGFFPVNLNSPFWSLSAEGANFSFATVKMTDAKGTPVAISNISRSNDYGDPAIIWQVSGTAASNSVTSDTTYHVTVSGISGVGLPTSHSYSVTLINPDRLTSSQVLSGPGKVTKNLRARFSLTPPSRAEALQVVAYKQKSATWRENAESKGLTKVIDGTGGNYPLLAKSSSFGGMAKLSGKSSFHLTFATPYHPILGIAPEQKFEIDREIIAKSKAALSFIYRRGFMTRGTSLAVEISPDGGVTWKQLGKTITGVSDTKLDSGISTASFPLPQSKKPVRLRFRYFSDGGAIYAHDAAPKSPTGIFIDDITVKRCDWLEPSKVNPLPATAKIFALNKKCAGGKLAKGEKLVLALRTQLGGKWFPIGPLKTVSVSGK